MRCGGTCSAAQRDLGGHAAPRHAAGEPLPVRPGADAAAGAERARHLGPGARADRRRGARRGAGGQGRRLAEARPRCARPACRGAAAPGALRPQRPAVALPAPDRARPGRRGAAHARGHRSVRRRGGRPAWRRLRLRGGGGAEAARGAEGQRTARPRVPGAARAVPAAARVRVAAASALSVPAAVVAREHAGQQQQHHKSPGAQGLGRRHRALRRRGSTPPWC